MSPTEIYVRQPSQWNVALITLGVLVAAYLYYGHLPIIFLLAGVVVVARLLTSTTGHTERYAKATITSSDDYTPSNASASCLRCTAVGPTRCNAGNQANQTNTEAAF
jgi:hypothetical protein